MKRTILILFPDEWAAYSQTLLNLVRELEGSFNVQVLAFDNGCYHNDRLDSRVFTWIRINPTFQRMLSTVRLYRPYKLLNLYFRTSKLSADHVIAIDSVAALAAQIRFGRYHLLSLEVENDPYFRLCRTPMILSLVIQSQERLHYLFPRKKPKTFLIQNAPSLASGANRSSSFERDHLIYFGNASPSHGIYSCIEALRLLSGTRMTVKGIVTDQMQAELHRRYGGLISSRRLVLDPEYLPQEKVIAYLSKFAAGFCLYDLKLIRGDDFNYRSTPSGKLFNYVAAGVPVIGSDIAGLRVIRDYQTGVLLKDTDPETIAQAVRDTLRRREEFSRNCVGAATEFDFSRAARPYREFLLSTVGIDQPKSPAHVSS